MDGALLDDPPLLRLAVPDAPLALAAEDPFRWAVEGRHGTSVYTRPLAGPVSPAFAVPVRCDERWGGGLLGEASDQSWRVRHRALSADGRLLFTLSSSDGPPRQHGIALNVWDLDARTLFGAPTVKRVRAHRRAGGRSHLSARDHERSELGRRQRLSSRHHPDLAA